MRTLVNLTLSLNTHTLTDITLKVLQQKIRKTTRRHLPSREALDLRASQLFRVAKNLTFYLFIDLF